MTDSSKPDTGAAPDAAAPAPRTRRRAASRPAGPPAAGEAGTQPQTSGDAAPTAEAEQPAAPAKRARASRTTKAAAKATKAATSAAEAPNAADSDSTPAPESGGDEAPAPAKKAARKRTAKKAAPAQRTATDTTAEAAADTTADAAADSPGRVETASTVAEVQAGAAPVKATRKRASRARTTRDQPVLPGSAEDAPAATLSAASSAASVRGQTGDEAQEAGRAGVGAAAVLFQAPDPVAAPPRRSRRATAPAGPPAAPEGADQSAAPGEQAATPETEPGDTQGSATDSDQDEEQSGGRKRRRRGGRGRRRRGDGDATDNQQDEGQHADEAEDSPSGAGDAAGDEADEHDEAADDHDDEGSASSRRRRRRRRRAGGGDGATEDPPGTVTKVRQGRKSDDQVASVKGSTRLEAKKQRRRDGREAGRRKQIITESEFLARRESVERTMIVRERAGRTQIAVLEDDVLVEHYVANETNTSMIGNVYLGRVQNVLPSMEAAFVDIGKGRNAVLYAGEVNWDAAGLEGQPRRIEQALKSGDTVLVQVTKDPLGHKGARLTSQISLPGRYLVYVPNSSMTGISRKLPDTERSRLKKILKAVVPDEAGVIVRTAAEGASEEELARDVTRLAAQWEDIQKKSSSTAGGSAPKLLHGEPDLTIRVVRDVFNEDFAKLVVSGDGAWDVVQPYLQQVAPDLAERASRWAAEQDVFAAHRVDEQLAKAMDRKVYLPSGGSLVIDRTEAMTVVDVNTGKFTGAGGNLEETVTRNNLEAAEEIVRQLRLRDIGGIIVVDFIDMVLESNRDLVLRRLVECLGRDRTKHQVAEVTSLGLVQMTRKRVGQGLVEVFSEPCEHCNGRGIIIHSEPVSKNGSGNGSSGSSGPGGSGASAGSAGGSGSGRRRGKGGSSTGSGTAAAAPSQPPRGPIPAGLVASLARHAEHHDEHHDDGAHAHELPEHELPEPDPHGEHVVAAASTGAASVETSPGNRAGGEAPAGTGRHAVAEREAVAEQQAVAEQASESSLTATTAPSTAEPSTAEPSTAEPSTAEVAGEAAVAARSAGEAPVTAAAANEAPSAGVPAVDVPAADGAPTAKPRRRRRASAPAGPPSSHQDEDQPDRSTDS